MRTRAPYNRKLFRFTNVKVGFCAEVIQLTARVQAILGLQACGGQDLMPARSADMARVCQVTGKKPMVGNNVSHANNKTKRRFLPNLQYRRFWVESENRWIRLRLTTNALRTIDKNGIDVVLAELRAKGEI